MKDRTEIVNTLTNMGQSLTELINTVQALKKETLVNSSDKIPKKGDITWVWETTLEVWIPRIFIKMEGKKIRCVLGDNINNKETVTWAIWAIPTADWLPPKDPEREIA